MDWPGWISAIAAVVSLCAAALAWWRANASALARGEAVAAESRAKDHLDAAKRTADSTAETAIELRRLADQVQRPMLTAERADRSWALVNNRESELTVEVINRADFYHIHGLPNGTAIPRRGQVKFTVRGALNMPVPDNLHLRLEGGTPIHVPLPE